MADYCFGDPIPTSRILADLLVYAICFIYVLCACVASYLFFKRSDKLIKDAYEKDAGERQRNAANAIYGAHYSAVNRKLLSGGGGGADQHQYNTNHNNNNTINANALLNNNNNNNNVTHGVAGISANPSNSAPYVGGNPSGALGGGASLLTSNADLSNNNTNNTSNDASQINRKYKLKDYNSISAVNRGPTTAAGTAFRQSVSRAMQQHYNNANTNNAIGTNNSTMSGQQQQQQTPHYMLPISASSYQSTSTSNTAHHHVGGGGGALLISQNSQRSGVGVGVVADEADDDDGDASGSAGVNAALLSGGGAYDDSRPTFTTEDTNSSGVGVGVHGGGPSDNNHGANQSVDDMGFGSNAAGSCDALTVSGSQQHTTAFSGVTNTRVNSSNNRSFNNGNAINNGTMAGAVPHSVPAAGSYTGARLVRGPNVQSSAVNAPLLHSPPHRHGGAGGGGRNGGGYVSGDDIAINSLPTNTSYLGSNNTNTTNNTIVVGSSGNPHRASFVGARPVMRSSNGGVGGGGAGGQQVNSVGRRGSDLGAMSGGGAGGGGGGGGATPYVNINSGMINSTVNTNDCDSGPNFNKNNSGSGIVANYGGVRNSTSSNAHYHNNNNNGITTNNNSMGGGAGGSDGGSVGVGPSAALKYGRSESRMTASSLNHVQGVDDAFYFSPSLLTSDKVLRFFLFLVGFLIARAINTFVSVLMGDRSIFSDAVNDRDSRRFQDMYFSFSTFLYYCLPLVLLHTFASILERISGNARFRRVVLGIFVVQCGLYWLIVVLLAVNARHMDNSLEYLGVVMSFGYVFLLFYSAYYFPRELFAYGSQLTDVSRRIRLSAITFAICMFLRVIVILPVLQDALSDILTTPGLIAMYMPLDLVPTMITMYALHKRQDSSSEGGGGGAGGGAGSVGGGTGSVGGGGNDYDSPAGHR